MTLLERYNEAYNTECAALAHGGPISMEHLQAMTLECLLEVTSGQVDVPTTEIVELIEALYKQGNRNG
jgi:hypothetical protein